MPSYLSYKNNLRVSLDAKDDNIESWITVRGNHIPIMKGQSKEEAVKSFLEHQAGKNDVPQGVKWTPTNKKGEGTGNKQTPKKEKYNIQHGARISDIESMINSYADNKAYSSWEEEEQFIAEKLKQEGIYAYGNQIKEAMKNVYGEEYEDAFKIKTPENSKEDIAKMAKSQQKRIPEEVGFGALEIAYNDVKFGSNPDTNKKLLLNAIHESGHEEEKAMAKLVEGMPVDSFKSAETFRKALGGKEGASIEETEKAVENFFSEQHEKNRAKNDKIIPRNSSKAKKSDTVNIKSKLDNIMANWNGDVTNQIHELSNLVDKNYTAKKISDWQTAGGISFGKSQYGDRGTMSEISINKELGDYILSANSFARDRVLHSIHGGFTDYGWEHIDSDELFRRLKEAKVKNGKYTVTVKTTHTSMYDD